MIRYISVTSVDRRAITVQVRPRTDKLKLSHEVSVGSGYCHCHSSFVKHWPPDLKKLVILAFKSTAVKLVDNH
jgi:hypothetical protein